MGCLVCVLKSCSSEPREHTGQICGGSSIILAMCSNANLKVSFNDGKPIQHNLDLDFYVDIFACLANA